jgi:hypothetical protein
MTGNGGLFGDLEAGGGLFGDLEAVGPDEAAVAATADPGPLVSAAQDGLSVAEADRDSGLTGSSKPNRTAIFKVGSGSGSEKIGLVDLDSEL